MVDRFVHQNCRCVMDDLALLKAITTDAVNLAIKKHFEEQEEVVIREMLGRWVSGLTPMLMVRNGEVIGLGAEEDVSEYPRVIVRPRPVRRSRA